MRRRQMSNFDVCPSCGSLEIEIGNSTINIGAKMQQILTKLQIPFAASKTVYYAVCTACGERGAEADFSEEAMRRWNEYRVADPKLLKRLREMAAPWPHGTVVDPAHGETNDSN
jgi:C4-type Zn-finger protein